jgi:hypothetical protein
VSGVAEPFNGHIDEFRIAHLQRSDGWIRDHLQQTMSDPAVSETDETNNFASGSCPS